MVNIHAPQISIYLPSPYFYVDFIECVTNIKNVSIVLLLCVPLYGIHNYNEYVQKTTITVFLILLEIFLMK